MRSTRIEVSSTVDPLWTNVIEEGLNSFNDAVVGYADRQPLAVVAIDADTGQFLGGAIGRTSLDLLFLDLFYLPEAFRGHGLGSEVLQKFEAEGKRRGCTAAVLYTISFQAPEFYKRHGWQVFGEIPCAPEGASRVFLSKSL